MKYHILDLLFSYKWDHKSPPQPKLVAETLRVVFSTYDLKLLQSHAWTLGFVGKPTTVSAGAKDWCKTFPHYEKFQTANNCYSFAMDDLRGIRGRKAVPGDVAGKNHSEVTWQTCDLPKQLVTSNQRIAASKSKECKTKDTYNVMLFVHKGTNPHETTDFHWYAEKRMPAFLDAFLKNPRKLRRVPRTEGFRRYMEAVEAKLASLPPVNPRTTPKDDLTKYHGIQSYFQRNDDGHAADKRFAVYANKAGWSDILTIFDRDGNVMLDPRTAKRGYNNGFTYDIHCSMYCIGRNKGRSSR
jgi:hypothetical protein